MSIAANDEDNVNRPTEETTSEAPHRGVRVRRGDRMENNMCIILNANKG